MPDRGCNPVSQTHAAHNGHLGTSEAGAAGGGDQGLCQLGDGEVVDPAAEEGKGKECDEDDDWDEIGFGEGRRRWRGVEREGGVDVKEADYYGNLENLSVFSTYWELRRKM